MFRLTLILAALVAAGISTIRQNGPFAGLVGWPIILAAFIVLQLMAFRGLSRVLGERIKLSEFVPVARTTDVADPGSTLVEVDDRLIVLIHAAGHWYALDDVCTHDGGPLSEGPLDATGGTIMCPRHGAKFDIKSGAAVTMPATRPTRSYEVKVEGDQIYVRLGD